MMDTRILAKLWSIIYDLMIYIKGSGLQLPDKIQQKIDAAETACIPYAEEYENKS